MIVTSFFPGRIRLRSPIFKDDEIFEKANKIIQVHASSSVTKIERNCTTGSILLEYDTQKLPLKKMEALKDFFLKLNHEAERYSDRNREKILSLLDEIFSQANKL